MYVYSFSVSQELLRHHMDLLFYGFLEIVATKWAWQDM